MPALNLVTAHTPGTYFSENQAGAIPAALASHSAVYMLGVSSKVGAPTNEIRLLTDLTDFENVFGLQAQCKSHAAAKLFFAQRSGVGLYFINVKKAATYPTLTEISTALTIFSKEDPQGFILAPEFYQSTQFASQHGALANVLEAHCADSRFYWVSLVDAPAALEAITDISAYVTGLVATRTALSSPLGHSWFYAGYVVDLDDLEVPASAAIAGVAIRRFRNEGYHQPAAGIKYPVYGIQALKHRLTDAHQEVLNPLGINIMRSLPNKGIVVWGARTLSTLPAYRYANNRVVMNVIAGTARKAYDQLLFQALDGLGIIFSVAKSTTIAFLEPLRLSGGLYGATPDDAYRVICDDTNNPGFTLDAGQLNVDVYVRCASTLEFMHINLFKVGLATPLSTLFATDDVKAIDEAASEGNAR
jgi:hypothetical protein